MGTGAEIWTQTGGGVTHVVAGIGTGGTVTGVGRALHDRGDVSVVGFTPAVEDHDVEGLRTNPSGDAEPTDAFDASVPDERYEVTSPDAWACARLLAKRHRTHVDVAETGAFESRVVRDNLRVDGEFLVGPSSGAAVALVRRLAAAGRLDEDDVVVVLLCDRGDRYLESLWADVR